MPSTGIVKVDCRALKNPWHNVKLRALSGKDEGIQDFIKTSSQFGILWAQVKGRIDTHESGILAIDFVCLGGKHRSMAMLELAWKYAT